MDLGLAGKRIIVSGASRGIGRTIAETFIREGAHVGICARGETELAQTATELASGGAKVFFRAFDVRDPDEVALFVDDASKALGGLDGVVVNASALSAKGPESWRTNFETDFMSLVRFIEAATPYLVQSGGGAVTYISTTSTMEAGPLTTNNSYSSMKAAGVQHAGAQSRVLGKDGIRVNVVSPGPIYFEGGAWEAVRAARPETYEASLNQAALGRMGTREDIANAVVFLSSPAAGHITGVNLTVDGGFTNRFDY